MGHLWHFDRRARAGLPSGEGPWRDLYTEGVAQRCEHVVAGEPSWHMAAQCEGWAEWCEREKGWLAREFLSMVEQGGDTRAFFGSWFEIRGHKQTGYFLGHEAVRRLEERKTLGEIALLEEVEVVFADIVQAIAEDSA